MSETIVTIEDAAGRLPELVEQVHVQREATVIIWITTGYYVSIPRSLPK